MTDKPTPRPDDEPENVSKGEAPQVMGLFTEDSEPDVHLDPSLAAFDRVQDGKKVDGEYEREYNRRYVKQHGDHHGNEPGAGEDV